MAVETTEYMKAARRFVAAAGRRAGDGDEAEMSDLMDLHRAVDDALRVAVDAQRATYGRSWGWIGEALGMTRQGAQQRFGEQRPAMAGADPGEALFDL